MRTKQAKNGGGLIADPSAAEKLSARFGKLWLKLQDAEQDMLRAIHKWEKLRAQLKRADKALGRQYASEHDVRELGSEDQHERARELGIAPKSKAVRS